MEKNHIIRFWRHHSHNLFVAFEAIMANRLKSALTALGILFGVAAVISMMAIGNGARQEILNQLKLVGVNNIIIKSKTGQGQKEAAVMGHGLSLADVEAIHSQIPVVTHATPEINTTARLIKGQIRREARIAGVNASYMDIFNLQTTNGRFFSEEALKNGEPVCILGHEIKQHVFGGIDPTGKSIKCGRIWLRVIGWLQPRNTEQSEIADKGIGHVDNTVFVPNKTMMLRFVNPAAVNVKGNKQSRNKQKAVKNFIDKIVVQVEATRYLRPVREILQRMLKRRHAGKKNFEIMVPELLLKQQQKTRNIFHVVLGAIAGISLLVGGIGIMNIMLASVYERIREVGIRRALGATARDIAVQFLAEASFISVIGGIAGVIAGVVISYLITRIAGILTIISAFSIFIAFSVSVVTGIVFGYLPAQKAAKLNPVNALHYE